MFKEFAFLPAFLYILSPKPPFHLPPVNRDVLHAVMLLGQHREVQFIVYLQNHLRAVGLLTWVYHTFILVSYISNKSIVLLSGEITNLRLTQLIKSDSLVN